MCICIGGDKMVKGKLFYSLGATAENAPSPLGFNWESQMKRRNWSEHLRSLGVEQGLRKSRNIKWCLTKQ